jgi:hypothetical protein
MIAIENFLAKKTIAPGIFMAGFFCSAPSRIKKGTLMGILKQAGIDVEVFKRTFQ